MPGGAYLIGDDGALVEMSQAPYDSEDMLQQLLASHPSLLAGNQLTPDSPRRWLLVTREMSVPAEAGGSGRWYLDHLFIDQDAVPTLVEVKRASNSQSRREVVAQMLDYAANAAAHWSADEVSDAFQAACDRQGVSAEEALGAVLGDAADVSAFWERFETNLRAGRVRMVFVADEIPSELLRVVEFLNEQMDSAEVLAVEIKQYVGGSQKALFPRLLGQTAQAADRKSRGPRRTRRWDEQSFMQAIRGRAGADAGRVAKTILDWAVKRHLRTWWGHGMGDGSFFPMLDTDGQTHFLVSVWTSGRLEVQFQWMKSRPPMDSVEKRKELQRKLNAIPGVHVPDSRLEGRPKVELSAFSGEDSARQLLDALDWVVQEIRGNSPA